MLKPKLQYFGHLMRKLTHWKRPWCWERLKAGGEGDDRGWDGWMASPTQCTWIWASSGRWWRTRKPGMLQSTGSQKDMTFATKLPIWLKYQFSRSVVSDSFQPYGLQHARIPCPSPTPWACSNSCSSSLCCHPTISSSVVPFSSHLQSFPASGSFQMSQFFTSGGQRIGVSASVSVLLMNTQDWSPLGWTGWLSLQSKGCSRVFSNTTALYTGV